MLHLTSAKYVTGKIVWVSFDDGTFGEIDLGDSLTGPIFEALQDETEFSKVYFDDELETIAWPNGADFAPEFLKDLLIYQTSGRHSA